MVMKCTDPFKRYLESTTMEVDVMDERKSPLLTLVRIIEPRLLHSICRTWCGRGYWCILGSVPVKPIRSVTGAIISHVSALQVL